jgi:hypothetical protein
LGKLVSLISALGQKRLVQIDLRAVRYKKALRVYKPSSGSQLQTIMTRAAEERRLLTV